MHLRRLKYLICFIGLFFAGKIIAQDSGSKYWIEFTDKNSTPFSIDQPEEFLSQRAIDRRTRQSIPISINDLPVDPVYLDSIAGLGAEIINVSRWFNGAIIELANASELELLANLSFVEGIPILIKPSIANKSVTSSRTKFDFCSISENEQYGPSLNQIQMLDGDIMHGEGIKGKGILIAILDAGFTNADEISSLRHIWDENRVLAIRDFVKDGKDFFNTHSHGTKVFSIIGGVEPEILYGAAPEADFLLLRTEDGDTEYLIEEYNWLCGAEFADSMGVDVINSSLGYSLFDYSGHDHTYAEMDGSSIPISIAAGIASSKGMVVVTSAGNSGNQAWHYITAPADAENILAVGATNPYGVITSFSSRGPSSDGRIKPDVSAQGNANVSQHPNGSFVSCTGTSCSSPVIAGMVACLWQAMPDKTSNDIIEYVKRSSSQYVNPDDMYGYGLPNFIKTIGMLREEDGNNSEGLFSLSVSPNPLWEYIFINIIAEVKDEGEEVTVSIYDLFGRALYEEKHDLLMGNSVIKLNDISFLSDGVYQLCVTYHTIPYSLLIYKF